MVLLTVESVISVVTTYKEMSKLGGGIEREGEVG